MNGPLSGFAGIAVDPGELRPVRDPHRRVDRPARREARRRPRSTFPRPRSASTGPGSPRRRRPGSGSSASHTLSVVVDTLLSSLRSASRNGGGDPPRRRAPGVEDLHLRLVARPEDHLRLRRGRSDLLAQLRPAPSSRPSTTASGASRRDSATIAVGLVHFGDDLDPAVGQHPLHPERASSARGCRAAHAAASCGRTHGRTLRFRRRAAPESGRAAIGATAARWSALGQDFCFARRLGLRARA